LSSRFGSVEPHHTLEFYGTDLAEGHDRGIGAIDHLLADQYLSRTGVVTDPSGVDDGLATETPS
jgi:hypothetical protein